MIEVLVFGKINEVRKKKTSRMKEIREISLLMLSILKGNI